MERDIRIDILKFFAVLLITNSHFDVLYAKYSFLGTGGAIGDALFFFCSGYTLFLSKQRTFGNYYKRRIARIYPTVLMAALVGTLFFNQHYGIVTILFGIGWFISCIMIYYVPLYFIRRYGSGRKKLVYAIVISIILVYYLNIDTPIGYGMYGNTWFKWVFNFLFIIQGAYVQKNNAKCLTAKVTIPMLLLSIITYYTIMYLSGKNELLCKLQVLSLVPLFGICYYLFKFCSLKFVTAFYYTKVGSVTKILAGLCLEIYLIQSYLINDKLNFLFPLNIMIVFGEIVVGAYLLRCMARWFAQTFDSKDYDWKAIVKL